MFPEYCHYCIRRTAELRQQFEAAIGSVENAWKMPIEAPRVVTGARAQVYLGGKLMAIHPSYDYSTEYDPRDTWIVKRCECGAEKCGSNFHSDWCPKHA